MAKSLSRIEQEAREVEKRREEVQRKIKQLSEQAENPQKYFHKETDERSQSRAERFRRYFVLDHATPTAIKKRKPTRAEMRMERNRIIMWLILAAIVIMWLLGSTVFKR